MGNGLRYANFHENLFCGDETKSFFALHFFPNGLYTYTRYKIRNSL